MKCPYCNKEIYGITGLQEIRKFMKHLPKCKKHLPKCKKSPYFLIGCDMGKALQIRSDSGQ